MINEELITAIRLVVREEVNASIYASEQRTADRFEKVDERFDKMDLRLTRIEIAQEQTQNDVRQLTVQMSDVKQDLGQVKQDLGQVKQDLGQVKRDLSETISVLDIATKKIQSLEDAQHALETKLDYHIMSIKREMKAFKDEMQGKMDRFVEEMQGKMDRFVEEMRGWSKQIANAVVRVDARLTTHERTPINKAHPPVTNY